MCGILKPWYGNSKWPRVTEHKNLTIKQIYYGSEVGSWMGWFGGQGLKGATWDSVKRGIGTMINNVLLEDFMHEILSTLL